MANLLQTIKQASAEVVAASDPSTFLYGTVISAEPLQIQIDQKTILPAAFFVLTSNVKDHEVIMEVDHETEAAEKHTHGYTGEKTFLVKNGLKDGERVILIKQAGGQKYLIVDRIKEGEG